MAATQIKNDKKIYKIAGLQRENQAHASLAAPHSLGSPLTTWDPKHKWVCRSNLQNYHYMAIHHLFILSVEKLLTFCEIGADIPSIALVIWSTLEMYGLKRKTLFFMLDNYREHGLIVQELQALFSAAGIPFNVCDKRLYCGRHKLYLAAQEVSDRCDCCTNEF
ncbi:hypothetical protein PM082_000057 [Marasmius tenuissimus]|nr:hypothetical protein PM082_000057 [Marasmius tenuissimus]